MAAILGVNDFGVELNAVDRLGLMLHSLNPTKFGVGDASEVRGQFLHLIVV